MHKTYPALNPVVKTSASTLIGLHGSPCETLRVLCRGAVWEERSELSGEGSGKEGVGRTLTFSGPKGLL